MDASEELRADHGIVLAAMQLHGGALKCASEVLRAYRKVVLAAVQKEGRALQYALRGAPRRIVLAAMQQHRGALKRASEVLRADHEIVLAAMQQHGGTLKCASEELRADHKIVRVTGQGLEVQCNMPSRCSALTTRSFWRPCGDSAVALSVVEKHMILLTSWLTVSPPRMAHHGVPKLSAMGGRCCCNFKSM